MFVAWPAFVCRPLASPITARSRQKYLELFQQQGGEAKFGNEVRHITTRGGTHLIETTAGEYEARFLVNCAGLHCDRVTRLAGADPRAKIIPFRGEYYELIARSVIS